MAIKKKADKGSFATLPGDLDNMLFKAFTEQFLSSKYDDLFKESKAEVLAYIKTDDDIEITQGEGFKTEYGSIILSERKNIKIDKDKLTELVEDGTISVAQLIACVSTFKNEDLEKTLSTSVFDTVAEKSATETFTFKATGEFKATCDAQFAPATTSRVETPKAPAPAPKPSIKEAQKIVKETVKAASKKSAKDADSDLDDILNSKPAPKAMSPADKARAAAAKVKGR